MAGTSFFKESTHYEQLSGADELEGALQLIADTLEADGNIQVAAATASAADANSSKVAAAASAAAAAASQSGAATSATNAASSASSAGTSATNASNSATTASTQATNASNSATAAAGSATSAGTSATNAANSATAANTSATNASNSATAANTSATNAATSATNAANSATAAATSASTASTVLGSSVRFDVSQSKTAGEKTQARTNMGAAAAADPSISGDVLLTTYGTIAATTGNSAGHLTHQFGTSDGLDHWSLATNWRRTDAAAGTIPQPLLGTAEIDVVAGGAPGQIRFSTGAVNTAPSERMRIDGSGNVGIGVSDPGRQLTIAAPGQPGLEFRSSGGTVGTKSMGCVYDGGGAITGGGLVWQALGDTGGFSANLHTFFRNGSINFGGLTAPTTAGDITFTNKVGIGTTAPNRPLTVHTSDTSVTGALKVNQAGTGDASMFFVADGQVWTAGIDNSDGNKFKISTDSVSADVGTSTKVTVDTAGQVGVGTTSPSGKLHVQGGDPNAASVSGSLIAGGAIDNERLALGYNSTSGYGWLQSAYVGVTYTPLVLNLAGGTVGIGTATFTTGAKLQVANGGVVITQTNPATNTLNYAFSPGSTFNTKGCVSITADWTTPGTDLGHALKVSNNIRSSVSQIGSSFAIEAATLVEQDWYDSGAILAYTGSPNVAYRKSAGVWSLGRGLCAPSGNMYHLFRATSECDSGNHPSVGYLTTASAADNFCVVGFQVTAADHSGFLCGPYADNVAGGADPTYPFAYNSKSYGALRFYVDAAGTVNVKGTDDGSSAIWIGRNNSGTITSVIRANGTFESAGGAASGGYAATSDRKLKENIVDAEPQLDKLCSVPVHQYNLIAEPETVRTGVIAQELAEVYSELVTETDFLDKGKVLAVNTTDLMYNMLKGMQELAAQVKTLQAEVTELRSRID